MCFETIGVLVHAIVTSVGCEEAQSSFGSSCFKGKILRQHGSTFWEQWVVLFSVLEGRGRIPAVFDCIPGSFVPSGCVSVGTSDEVLAKIWAEGVMLFPSSSWIGYSVVKGGGQAWGFVPLCGYASPTNFCCVFVSAAILAGVVVVPVCWSYFFFADILLLLSLATTITLYCLRYIGFSVE